MGLDPNSSPAAVKALTCVALVSTLLGCPSASGTQVAGSTEGCRGAGCGQSSRAQGGSSARSTSTSIATSGSASSSIPSGNSGGRAPAERLGRFLFGRGGEPSGGGSGNGFCGSAVLPDGGGCANGSYVTAFIDVLSCAPIVGATVQALNADSVPVPGTVLTGADGTFVLCGPPGSAFTPFFAAPTYETTYFAELRADTNSHLPILEGISATDLTALGSFVPGGFQPSLGILFVHVNVSASCPEASGWSLALTEPDGGALADGGYVVAYLSTAGFPDATLAATSLEGVAFIYDIDLSTGNYFAVSASQPDAGACQPVLTGDGASLTGRVYVTVNAISNDSLIQP